MPPEAFPYLFKAALSDKSDKVRSNARMSCWNRFPYKTEKCILQLLEDPECSPLLKERAIHITTYNKIFSQKLRERLKQILFSVSEPGIIRAATVQPLFWRCGKDESEELFEKCVHYHDSLVREFAAIYVASIFFTHDYDKYLLELLCDIDCKVSKEAAHALIKHGDAITIEKLENLLNTDISEKASVAIRNTIRGIEHTFLFSIDSKFQSDLDNTILSYRISESLRREFENHGSLLKAGSRVSIKKAGSGWVILGKNEHYLVRKEENKLNIYDKTL
ncbi:TPA: hypothetical protein EYP75_01495 [Candidatus Bathyarchaeota archaeon]|nr:hypothetical protein [Candidatus Bathyarchaeota archaeon]